jgi:hypothetical protein
MAVQCAEIAGSKRPALNFSKIAERETFLIGGGMPGSSQQAKPAVSLPGTVDKIIPENSVEPEKAQISVEGGDHLYREIRVENTLQDENGKEVKLKPGAEVHVTIEAEKDATIPKK